MIYPLILSFLGGKGEGKIGKERNKDNQEVEKTEGMERRGGAREGRGKGREAEKEKSRAHRGSTLLLFEGQALVILVTA